MHNILILGIKYAIHILWVISGVYYEVHSNGEQAIGLLLILEYVCTCI